jgi:hypothetical protein
VDLVAVNNFGDTREGGLAGPMGLFIIVMMSIATVLLIRNMNKRLRRLPDSFDKVDASSKGAGKVDSESLASGEEPAGNAAAVDNDRSNATAVETEPQVNGVEPDDRPAASDGSAAKS